MRSIGVLEPVAASVGIGDEVAHLLVQRGLIPLDRKQIVRTFVDDLGGNAALAAHGVDADQQALDVQGLKQFGGRRHGIRPRIGPLEVPHGAACILGNHNGDLAGLPTLARDQKNFACVRLLHVLALQNLIHAGWRDASAAQRSASW